MVKGPPILKFKKLIYFDFIFKRLFRLLIIGLFDKIISF